MEDNEKVPNFAARMRVAYRRDDIKLRNRSFYTKPLVENLRLLFLVSGSARIEAVSRIATVVLQEEKFFAGFLLWYGFLFHNFLYLCV